MKRGKFGKKKTFIVLLFSVTICIIASINIMYAFPSQITLLEGQEHIYKSPFMLSIKADNSGVVGIDNKLSNKSQSAYASLFNTVSVKSAKKGVANLRVKAFGLIPVKTLRVSVLPDKKIAACGNTVGVRINADGILVIGISDVETIQGKRVFPARECGIRPGDLIQEINSEKLYDIKGMVKCLDRCNGFPIELKYKRGNSVNNAKVTPVKALDDKQYHLGLWVRDSTAGIGTLTFYDPSSKSFGALGHGIVDSDTGVLMPLSDGEIIESSILTVRKGVQGNPGELKGIFLDNEDKVGIVNKNCDYGIYGVLNEDYAKKMSCGLYPIAFRNQVKEGKASIIANIDGKTVEQYGIVIQKVSKYGLNNLKGMVIKITDKRLLDATGGIVQGMSGSPIIQDGKIAGAVTHVLVNDPTRGYGVFIEWMLQNIQGNVPLRQVG